MPLIATHELGHILGLHHENRRCATTNSLTGLGFIHEHRWIQASVPADARGDRPADLLGFRHAQRQHGDGVGGEPAVSAPQTEMIWPGSERPTSASSATYRP